MSTGTPKEHRDFLKQEAARQKASREYDYRIRRGVIAAMFMGRGSTSPAYIEACLAWAENLMKVNDARKIPKGAI